MSNEDQPITSRRARRLAQASLGEPVDTGLTPAQAAAEARGRAEAEAEARRRAEAEAAAEQARTSEAREAAQRAREAADREAADPEAPRNPAPAAAPAQPERSSQTRARDRATQRVLRELAEKEQAAQSARQSFPTRRSIRERETGKLPTIGTPPRERLQEGESANGPSAQALPIIQAPQAASPQAPAPRSSAATRQPAADSAGAGDAVVRGPVPGVDPAPPTAMQGIIPQGLTVTPALGPETGSFRRLSHEQIAAARELLKEQAKNQTAMLEAQRGGDGTDVDPAVLAEQVAMAERAAILNRRAQAKQRLAEESRREAAEPVPARKAPAPAATDNLAMVTPLEFVRLPGVAHPVMKPPTTTHVPVTTGRTTRQAAQPTAAAHMTTRPEVREAPEAAPVSARSAHGLDPLNAAQAGAGRAERERLILLIIAAVGFLALIVAIIMIVLGGK